MAKAGAPSKAEHWGVSSSTWVAGAGSPRCCWEWNTQMARAKKLRCLRVAVHGALRGLCGVRLAHCSRAEWYSDAERKGGHCAGCGAAYARKQPQLDLGAYWAIPGGVGVMAGPRGTGGGMGAWHQHRWWMEDARG